MPEDRTMHEEMNAAAADAAFDSPTDSIPARGDSSADEKIAAQESELRDASERALRAQAELENFRKRAQRELAEERRYAVVPLVRDLLPVVDNLERAIEATLTRRASEGGTAARSASEGGTVTRSVSEGSVVATDALLEGVKMVASQLDAVLKQHQCIRIEAVGAPFDPNQHEAIAQEPSDQHPAGTVTRAVQSGYKLYDRVIRPAQVFVSTGPGKAE
jgi:molecular chaperone GrpE